ncbi:hypothetical protein EVAR_24946_1 [Eumeta japonica]|uniref:Uncharacterized protein n=1 Tax=Eumeta variegata TaxID=151549 RepID=A0A4C2A1W7_EUMVA|nr:hypothetical protein EVAR_24946_1 [Eumeta japonica]
MPKTQNNEDAGFDSVASPGTSNEVCRLTTKNPPFWPEEPIIWFAQIEGLTHHNMDKPLTTKYTNSHRRADSTYFELLADLADRVHEIAPPSLQVASTSTVSVHASTLENLTSEIAELRRQMRQLTTHSIANCVQSHVATPKDPRAFYNLMVDIRNRRLIENTTTLSTSESDATSSNMISSVKILLGDTRYDKLLAKFPDMTRPSGTLRNPKHNTVHFIKTTPGPPVSSPPRRLAPDKLQIAKCEFEAMLKMVLPDLPKAAGRHPFTSHRRRNQDGDPVATIGC